MNKQTELGFISRLKARDNVIFLICFVCAALIWLTTKLATERSYNIDVPITFKKEETTIVLSELPEAIKISIQGEIGNIMRFQRSINKSKLSLNIQDTESLNFTEINNLLTKNLAEYQLTLLRNQTGNIPLVLDSLSKKEVLIFNNTNPIPAEGYMITSNEIEPDRVTISGPSSFIFHVDSILTNKLNKKNVIGISNDSIDLLKSVSELITFESDKVAWNLEAKQLINFEKRFPLAAFNYPTQIADSVFLYYRTIKDLEVNESDFEIYVNKNLENQDIITFESTNKYVKLDKYLLNSK